MKPEPANVLHVPIHRGPPVDGLVEPACDNDRLGGPAGVGRLAHQSSIATSLPRIQD